MRSFCPFLQNCHLSVPMCLLDSIGLELVNGQLQDANHFIMIILIQILFLSASVITARQTLKSQNTLSFNMLNYGQSVSLSLGSYLDAPKFANVDLIHSSKNVDAISYAMTSNQPVIEISSLELTAAFPNGSLYTFSQADVLQTYSIYNQPNKIFLMKGNVIASVRYQFSDSDEGSSMTVTQIIGELNCTQISTMQISGKYYVVVACLKSDKESVLYSFRFNSTNPGTINGLIPLDPVSVTMNSTCIRWKMYSFREFALKKMTYYNSILYFCAENSKHKESLLYFLSIVETIGVEQLNCFKVETYELSARNLQACLIDSSWITKYEQGILVQQNNSLSYYKYNRIDDDSNCETLMAVDGVAFIDAIEDQDIQYIYMIFEDKMIIKESYSPNFQTIQIRKITNMTLQSYAIVRKFLTLLYVNATHNYMRVYDLFRVYPSEVDHIVSLRNKSQLTVYSVNNFLESGNYYLTYDEVLNKLSLSYYQGYLFTFSVKDPVKALPKVILNISDQQNQNLVIECVIKDFNDSSISQTEGSNFLKTYRELLNINLSDYIQGPLGKFYSYPNNISAFQYINEFSEIDISAYLKMSGRPLSISFNNYLNAAIINFYYSSLANTCELNFEAETKTVSLSDCKALKRKKFLLQVPREIVVLSEDKYLHYNDSIIQYCSLSSNNEFECLNIKVSGISTFSKIRLVKYYFTKNTDEVIEMVIYNAAEIVYCCIERNVYYGSAFNFTLHYSANASSLPQLTAWSIKSLLIDEGYQQFMIMHLTNNSNNHKVIVFDKPIAGKNSSSFIGHVIQTFDFAQLEGIFCISNLLVAIYPTNDSWIIQQYQITKYYKVKETRRYPLYNFVVHPNGNHHQDGNYIYIQAFLEEENVYIVFSPLRTSSGVLSHKFLKKSSDPLLFAQQIGQVNDNSMGVNGNFLFGLVCPSLIFKFMTQKVQMPQMGQYQFQVSVLDSTNKMNILTYQFNYNQGEEGIHFEGSTDVPIQFDDRNFYAQFHINPEKINGPVNSYHLEMPDDCDFFAVQSSDIFTKEGCLAYTNPNKFGALSDFLAVSYRGINLEIVVTDSLILCVLNRQLFTNYAKTINGLGNCKFEMSFSDIIMICDNTTSLGKIIYNVTVTADQQSCAINIELIKLPKWLNYGDFAAKFSGLYLIFEVPIRYKQNCIYYKALISNNQISQDNYSLLVGVSKIVSEFETVDTSISSELFFILDNGVGIYNLSDWASEIKPALWLSQSDIFHVSNNDESLVYLKFLNMEPNRNGSQLNITLQLGTYQSAYEVMIRVICSASTAQGQTTYSSPKVEILYQYKQYMSCHNNLQSKSQNYGNLIIKICNYQPPDELVFANFISIAHETTGALIQFYNRSGSSSYPYRIDTIYSNFLSHHSFVIREDSLIVASLFNLLCYYALSTTLTWQFTYINATTLIFDPQKLKNDKKCEGSLIISNLQFQQILSLSVTYDYDQNEEDYWSDPSYYIQRAIIFLILANTLRLFWRSRKSKHHLRLKKRFTGRLHTNRFEVMVKINSKMSN